MTRVTNLDISIMVDNLAKSANDLNRGKGVGECRVCFKNTQGSTSVPFYMSCLKKHQMRDILEFTLLLKISNRPLLYFCLVFGFAHPPTHIAKYDKQSSIYTLWCPPKKSSSLPWLSGAIVALKKREFTAGLSCCREAEAPHLQEKLSKLKMQDVSLESRAPHSKSGALLVSLELCTLSLGKWELRKGRRNKTLTVSLVF